MNERSEQKFKEKKTHKRRPKFLKYKCQFSCSYLRSALNSTVLYFTALLFSAVIVKGDFGVLELTVFSVVLQYKFKLFIYLFLEIWLFSH